MREENAIAIFYPASLAAWREWLDKNHSSAQAVWVVFYKISSKKHSISWSEAVDVALCFGWIDSKKIKIDEEKSHQFFCKRKPNSTWSKINKQKVQHLAEAGLMTEAGYKCIEIAKQNGSWTILDEVEELIMPKDLDDQFETRPGSKDFFLGLSKSVKKSILQWIAFAKRPETRQKRINEIAELASQKLKPKQF